MSNSTLIMLVILYGFPLVLLALLLSKRPLKQSSISILLLAIPAFYIFHFYTLQASQGWPSEDELPNQFDLISQQIIEPNKKQNNPGQIYLWVIEEHSQAPRSYALPYSKELHVKLTEAQARQTQGKVQVGKREPSTPNKQGSPNRQQQNINFENKPSVRAPLKPSSNSH